MMRRSRNFNETLGAKAGGGTMKLCFVAAPLIARSGVYNSALELVETARGQGHQWTAVLGVAPTAQGDHADGRSGVHEFDSTPGGLGGVRALRRRLLSLEYINDADLVVTLTPQADMALALTELQWVAYLRGLPWPSVGEGSAVRRQAWRSLERIALRRALETWSTTSILAEEARVAIDRLVPPGIRAPADSSKPSTCGRDFVWAARYSVDKNPSLFMDVMAQTSARGVMYGTGPLQSELQLAERRNVIVAGWRNKADLWRDARAYVGTSHREAFGRSAVEAAMLGLPVLISDRFGCAPMLYTDPNLQRRFVLPTDKPELWIRAINDLDGDQALRQAVAAHTSANAQRLSIESAVQNVDHAAAAAADRA